MASRLALGMAVALAAGATAGVLTERAVVGRGLRAKADQGEPFGNLRAEPQLITTDDGADLYVEIDECEQGPTVIFSHGYSLNLDCWHYQRRDLRGRARLVFWDQRGHGRSTRGPGGYGTGVIDRLGADLGAVLDAVAPQGPVVLVGHSMGGMTVMALAAARPEIFGDRVRAAALLGTSAGGLGQVSLGLPAPVGRALQRFAPSAVTAVARNESVARIVRDRTNDLGLVLTHLYSFGSAVPPDANAFTAEMLTATPLDVVADFLPAFAAHDAIAALPAFDRVDTLVMVGTADRLTPESHSHEIVRHVSGAELVVLPNTGHMLMLERHREVTAHLRSLIEQLES